MLENYLHTRGKPCAKGELTSPDGVSERELPELALGIEDVVAPSIFVAKVCGIGKAIVLEGASLLLGVVDLVLGPVGSVAVEFLDLSATFKGSRLGGGDSHEGEEENVLEVEQHLAEFRSE